MVSVFIAIVFSMVTSENIQRDYADAYQESVKQKKPLMVVVAAPYCRACNVLKESTIAPMVQTGELDQVSLTVINKEEQPELVKQLTGKDTLLPQIIVFTPDQKSGGWKRRKLLGFQPKQPVRNLIRRALGS